MRIGKNPAKGAATLPAYGRHRVIVPVYIPHFDGYFAHALEVLELCLQSLHGTAAGRSAVTVIANGCCVDTIEWLQARAREGWFDQLIINRTNRGKVDAILSAARGCLEPFITLSDCDVLFRIGWMDAVEDVFRGFPESGTVGLFPAPPLMWHHTSSTLIGGLLRRELRFEKVADDQGFERLGQSVGNPNFVQDDLREAHLVARRGEHIACVGASHIVMTIRREALLAMPDQPSLKSVAGRSEAKWIDEPSDRAGYWRLATPTVWASHMGNTPEPWMHEELAAIRAASASGSTVPAVSNSERARPVVRSWTRWIPLAMRQAIVRQIQRPTVLRMLKRRRNRHVRPVTADQGALPARGVRPIAERIADSQRASG